MGFNEITTAIESLDGKAEKKHKKHKHKKHKKHKKDKSSSTESDSDDSDGDASDSESSSDSSDETKKKKQKKRKTPSKSSKPKLTEEEKEEAKRKKEEEKQRQKEEKQRQKEEEKRKKEEEKQRQKEEAKRQKEEAKRQKEEEKKKEKEEKEKAKAAAAAKTTAPSDLPEVAQPPAKSVLGSILKQSRFVFGFPKELIDKIEATLFMRLAASDDTQRIAFREKFPAALDRVLSEAEKLEGEFKSNVSEKPVISAFEIPEEPPVYIAYYGDPADNEVIVATSATHADLEAIFQLVSDTGIKFKMKQLKSKAP